MPARAERHVSEPSVIIDVPEAGKVLTFPPRPDRRKPGKSAADSPSPEEMVAGFEEDRKKRGLPLTTQIETQEAPAKETGKPPKPTRFQLEQSIAQQKMREEKKAKAKKQEVIDEPIIELVDAVEETQEERALSQLREGAARARRHTSETAAAIKAVGKKRSAIEVKDEEDALISHINTRVSRKKIPSTDELETTFLASGEKESFENKARHRKILTEEKSASQMKSEADRIAAEALRKQITELVEVKPTKRWPDEESLPQKNPIKDEVIRRGYRGDDISVEKRGIGLREKEWFAQGEDTEKQVEKKPRKEKEVAEKPGFWKRAGGFFKSLFGGSAKSDQSGLDDLLKSMVVPDTKNPILTEVRPGTMNESGVEQLEPVSMSAVLDLWNKDYAKRGVRLVLDKMPGDGRNMVNNSVLDIVSRLKQRLDVQLLKNKNNVSDYEYNANIKSLLDDLATELVRKGKGALAYKQRSYPKFPEKSR